MSALEWKIAAQLGSGPLWEATAAIGGLAVTLTVRLAPIGRCPCNIRCDRPGEPVITVYATASVPMVTLTAGSRTDLVTVEQDMHREQPWLQPEGDVTTLAMQLARRAARDGRDALAELAGYAARLGITNGTAVTEWGVRTTSVGGYHQVEPAPDAATARKRAASAPLAADPQWFIRVVNRVVGPWTPAPEKKRN